jgi:hypothetical protein
VSTEKDAPEFPIPRVAVEGTVVAAEDGRPLAGATVVYYFDPAEEYKRKTPLRAALDKGPHPMIGVPPTKTDKRGRFRFDAIPFWPGAPRKIGAELPGRFPSSRTVEFTREGDTLRVDLRLGRAGLLRGTVRMADGKPVSGAEISYFGSFQRRREKPWGDRRYPCHRFHWDCKETRTGPDGRYELGPFPHGVSVHAMCCYPWGNPRGVSLVPVPEDTGEAVQDLVLDPAGQVEVTLVPGKGPLPSGVHLDVRSAEKPAQPGSGHGLGNVAEFPHPSWRVLIPSVTAGRSILVIRTSNPRGPGAERRIPLRVRAGELTRVRVPMPPAVSRRPWKPGMEDRFFLDDIPPGGIGGPKATVIGIVRDAVTGKPVRGAVVSDIWRPEGESLGDCRSGGVSSLEIPPVRTDARGRFRLARVPFEAGIARKVLIEAAGYWTTARVYEFRRVGENRRFDIRLRSAGILRGTVRDPEGRKSPGVELHAIPNREPQGDWEERLRHVCTQFFGSGTVRATTGPNGRFALSPLPFDRWFDVLPGNGVASGIPHLAVALSAGKPEARLDFVLEPGGTLMVEVCQPTGLQEREIRLELRRPDGGTVLSGGWNLGSEFGMADPVRSQDYPGLPPGDYLLVVTAEGRRAPKRPYKVRIRRGKTTLVRVRLRGPEAAR